MRVIILTWFFSLCASEFSSAAEASSRELEKLVEQLSSPRFAQRVQASRALAESENSRAFVVPLLSSQDKDLAERARWILAEHAQRFAPPLGRYLRYARSGQIERMIVGLAQWGGPVESEELWRTALDSVALFRDRSEMAEKAHGFAPVEWSHYTPKPPRSRTFERLKSPLAPADSHADLSVCSDGHQIVYNEFCRSLVISNSEVGCRSQTISSIILTSGDFRTREPRRQVSFRKCIIIAAGEVCIAGDSAEMNECLIIARGPIDLSQTRSVLNSHIISSSSIKEPYERSHRTDSKQAMPLDFIRWFSPEDIGLVLKTHGGEAEVQRVCEKTVAAFSGIIEGDRITRIEGASFNSPEELRRLLLRGSVMPTCILEVKRGDKKKVILLDFRTEGK